MMMRTLFLLMIGLAACGAKAGDKAAATSQPGAAAGGLYDRLGKTEGITAVVDDFVTNVAADDNIKARFANTDIPAFKQKLVEQICEASGGPCKYSGKSMKEAHAGMKVSDAEFTALVGDLKRALEKHNVAQDAQNQLLTTLGAMHDDIVGH